MPPVMSPGVPPTLSIGGRVFTDLKNLIVLHSHSGNAAARWSTMRLPNASSGYAVPVGKTLRIAAAVVIVNTPTAYKSVEIGYGDTDVGFDSSSAPTNPIYMAGDSGIAGASQLGTTDTNGKYEIAGLNFTVPAGKYAFQRTDAGPFASVWLYGYLE